MHAHPGGHWNDAYSFVALHQPSAFYGVNSMEFGDDVPDDYGPNAGFFPLASGTEISAYFTQLVNRRFLPSGRVAYRKLTEWLGTDEDGTARLRSILSGEESAVHVRRKTVDATFYKTSVPATHKRQYAVADGVRMAIPGELPDLWKHADDLPEHYVIVGAGKTAMDAGVWLLQAGVAAHDITWVRPRDSWLINRAYTQPGPDHFEAVVGNQVAQLEAAAEAESGDEMFRILGESGHMLRIDPDTEPTMFHYATISEGEVELLRRIENVVREGRVTSIEPGVLSFGQTRVAVPENSLFVDCTATAVPFSDDREHGPVFRGNRIVLQPLHVPLVTLSAAVCAFLEASFDSDDERNALARPAPLTDTPNTYPLGMLGNFINRGAWSQNAAMSGWLARARLDPMGRTIAKLVAEGSPKLAALGRFQGAVAKGLPGLQRLARQAEAEHVAR